LLGTNVGIGWLMLLAVSLAGFVLLGQSLWLDVVWAAILFAATAVSGHAAAMEPQWATVALDVAHLAAAAVWTGGFVLALAVRRADANALQPYLRAFLPASLAALALLAATGVVSALLYLPSFEYLLRTQYGIVLLVKTGIALLAAVAAIAMRSALPRAAEPGVLRSRMKAALTLTVALMLSVGLLTHMSPKPTNKPLYWHEMGETMHMTARIQPMYAGDNTFTAKVWVPEGEADPKSVTLTLTNTDKPDREPVSFELQSVVKPSETFFEDFTEHSYQADGRYLNAPGNWLIEVTVVRASGEEMKYSRKQKVN